jgi:hypothetical protein
VRACVSQDQRGEAQPLQSAGGALHVPLEGPARRCHICARTGLTPSHVEWDWAHPLPRLQWDWARRHTRAASAPASLHHFPLEDDDIVVQRFDSLE